MRVKVAVYNAILDNGLDHGKEGILAALKEMPGIEAEYTINLSLENLLKYDVLIMAEINNIGKTYLASEIFESTQKYVDWKAHIVAYVNSGHGILLTHNCIGITIGSLIDRSLFPAICQGRRHYWSLDVVKLKEHPVTKGVKPYRLTQELPVFMDPALKDKFILLGRDGDGLAAAGEHGRGRVVAYAGMMGTDYYKEIKVEGEEKKFLRNAIEWLGGASPSSLLLRVSPQQAMYNQAENVKIEMELRDVESAELGNYDLELKMLSENGEPLEEGEELQKTFRLQIRADKTVRKKIDLGLSRLPDGVYLLSVEVKKNKETVLPHAPMSLIRLNGDFCKKLEELPRKKFIWRAMNIHAPAESEEDLIKMIRECAEMRFNVIIYDDKLPRERPYVYHDTKILLADKDPRNTFDHLKLIVEEASKYNIKILVQYCVFIENGPSRFLEAHPEYRSIDVQNETNTLAGGIFACPDRPEVRAHQLSIMKEILENYDVDGISLDYIRYQNDCACYCEYSNLKRVEFANTHPELSQFEVLEAFSKMSIMTFIEELRDLMNKINPSLILHGYCHQSFSNEFALDYNSSGIYIPEDQNIDLVLKGCQAVIANNGVARGVPCLSCFGGKSVTRLREELRVASYAGADKIMIFCYEGGVPDKSSAPDGSTRAQRRRVYQEEFR